MKYILFSQRKPRGKLLAKILIAKLQKFQNITKIRKNYNKTDYKKLQKIS